MFEKHPLRQDFMAIERILTGSVRDQLRDLMQTEDLVLEAVRDLVKDELKSHIKNRIDDDPELKEELRESLTYYFNAKARSVYAELKATRAAARLGLSILPDDLHEEVSEALVTLFERELGSVLERAL
jgi:hypothetical protein|tara:strand:+ start:10454 stop:10837 length:384 start_codon:yes stop_codon:yes gene_type:complete